MAGERGSGAAAFADEVATLGGHVPNAALTGVVTALRRPLAVAVVGRPGVGRTTVETALRARGVRVAGAPVADVRVLVIAETVKVEDRAVLAGSPVPTLVVLTKADLLGTAHGGPLAAARRCAQRVQATTGTPVEPMIGVLAALVRLDPESWAALRTLVDEPADLSSVDAFVTAGHSVPSEVRARLLARLDRFGVAHAVVALADGADPTAVLARLRALSNVDGVLTALHRAGAVADYRRISGALAELRCEYARSGDEEVARFAGAHATAMAVMTAAVEVVEADGLTVDRADDPDAHARRAVRWAAYGRGPVGALHRACAADIVRGSLRLLDRGV